MRQRLLSAVLCCAVCAIPIAPVEHVHQTAGSDGHGLFVAHAHAANHQSHLTADHRDGGLSLDDDDSVVLTVDTVLAVGASHQLSVPVRSQVARLEEPAVTPRAHSAEFVERVIHGPPRAPSVLRGPPAPSLL